MTVLVLIITNILKYISFGLAIIVSLYDSNTFFLVKLSDFQSTVIIVFIVLLI